MSNWYTELDLGAAISQGDILFNCPILSIKTDGADMDRVITGDAQELSIEYATTDVVVVSQACDVETRKIPFAVVAQLWEAKDFVPKEEAKANELDKEKARKDFFEDLRKGNRPNYFLLGPHSGNFSMGYQIVDLSRIYTIDLNLLAAFQRLTETRLRLNTPHRELLNQALGHYFSRIGLPNEDHIDKKALRKAVL